MNEKKSWRREQEVAQKRFLVCSAIEICEGRNTEQKNMEIIVRRSNDPHCGAIGQ